MSAALVLGLAAATSTVGVRPEPVVQMDQVPVGITSSLDGRLFVALSRAIDPEVPVSVVELGVETVIPFPPGFLQDDGTPGPERLLAVQALVVDQENVLWILDSGRVGTNAVPPNAPKLVAYDLDEQRVRHNISFAPEVAGPTSFLNDLRIDLSRGRSGVVYITDASPEGPNAIVVVDIATGRAVRRLDDHPSTRPDPNVTLRVAGRPIVEQRGPDPGAPFRAGADGIALSPNGEELYYSPLTSRHLYVVPTDALLDDALDEAARGRAVEDLGDRGFASDGLLMDPLGRLYATDIEHDAIRRLRPDGGWDVVAAGHPLSWPDTMTMLIDGTLLVTNTQIHRGARFRGWDQRRRPFLVAAIPTLEDQDALSEAPPSPAPPSDPGS